jgi:hypothetical protein
MNTDCQKDLSQVFTPDLKKKLQGRIQKDYQNYKSEYEQAKRRVPIITSLKWIDPLVTRLIDGTKLLLENFNKNS